MDLSGFSLLAPLSAAIAGAIALPLFLLLYFLKLRRKPLRVSSTLLWEQAVSDLQVNTPLRWIRFSFLLLLQLLALLCLILAIGRPALNMDRASRQRLVILIDRSAPMSATDATGPTGTTRLTQAKRQARELFSSVLRAGDASIMIVAFAHQPTSLTPFTSDVAVLEEALDAITPTDQPADFPAAVTLLGTLTGDRSREDARPEPTSVYVFSSAGFNPDQRTPIAGDLDVRLVRVGPALESDLDNLGIAELSAKRDEADPASVRLFARVINASRTTRNAPLTITLDDQPIAQITLEIPPTTIDATGQISIGQATLTTPVPAPTGGVLSVRIDRPDALASDDRAALMLSAPSKPRVLLVAPGAGGKDADPFLSGTLRVMDKASLDVIGLDQYRAMTGSPQAKPNADIVIFDRVAPASPPSVASLCINVSPVPEVKLAPVASASPARLVTWDRRHPILRYCALDTIVFAHAQTLSGPAPDSEASKRATLETIATLPSGPVMGVVRSGGLRHIVLGTELDFTNWSPHFSFPIFVSSCVEWLTLRAQAQAGRSFTTTEPAPIEPAPGATQITLTRAGDKPITLAVTGSADSPEGLSASAGVIDRAGIHTLTGATTPALCVNVADAWSSLIRTSDKLTLVGGRQPISDAESRTPREIWNWFVLAGLALLTIEWIIFSWQARRG